SEGWRPSRCGTTAGRQSGPRTTRRGASDGMPGGPGNPGSAVMRRPWRWPTTPPTRCAAALWTTRRAVSPGTATGLAPPGERRSVVDGAGDVLDRLLGAPVLRARDLGHE